MRGPYSNEGPYQEKRRLIAADVGQAEPVPAGVRTAHDDPPLFTVWYLKQKQLLSSQGGAGFQITAEGVEFVEAALPSSQLLQRLLRAPTLDLKPIPAAVSAESAGKPGEGAIRRITKAVRTTRAKKAKRKGA